jgi:hypothetical protein
VQLLRHFSANAVQLDPFPFKRELSMAAYVVENEGVLALDSETLSNVEVVETELSLKQGRHSRNTDGRIDLLVTYSQEVLGVIELKLGQLTSDHLAQLEDYLKERDQILKACPDALSPEAAGNPKWIGVLVGSSIDPELAKKLIAGHIAHDSIPIAALTIQRYLSADNQVYVVTDTYFGGFGSAKDTSKYKFQGQVLGKGRLVLEVVKRHVEANPAMGFQDLLAAFPAKCQGSWGVFAREDNARDIYARSGRSRHFLSQEDVIRLTDTTIAVCSQWGIGNIDKFVLRARELGYDISPADR